jgi:hypothetical protein
VALLETGRKSRQLVSGDKGRLPQDVEAVAPPAAVVLGLAGQEERRAGKIKVRLEGSGRRQRTKAGGADRLMGMRTI